MIVGKIENGRNLDCLLIKDMSMRLFLFIIYFLFQIHASDSKNLSSVVCEMSSPTEVISILSDPHNCNSDTLFIFDIDDTLIFSAEPALQGHTIDDFLAEISYHNNMNSSQALMYLEHCLGKAGAALGQGRLLSPLLKEFIDKCIENKINVIAITKVEPGYKRITLPSLKIKYTQNQTGEDRRLADLLAVGISFENSFNSIFKNNAVPLKKINDVKFEKYPVYKSGIILTGRYTKGEALEAFLKEVKWSPKKIVFVDNLRHHVENLKDTARKLHIQFVGVIFSYVESIFTNQDYVISEKQKEVFHKKKEWFSRNKILHQKSTLYGRG